MYPTLVRFGEFEVTTFGALVALAALTGLWMFHRELAARPPAHDRRRRCAPGSARRPCRCQNRVGNRISQPGALSFIAAEPRRAQLVRRIPGRGRRWVVVAETAAHSDHGLRSRPPRRRSRLGMPSDELGAFSSVTTTAGRPTFRGAWRFPGDCRRRAFQFIRPSCTRRPGLQSSRGSLSNGGAQAFRMPWYSGAISCSLERSDF